MACMTGRRTPRRGDYDDSDHLDESEFDPVHDAPDAFGPLFGSSEEIAARQTAIEALRELEKCILAPFKPTIGHNHPPSPIDDDDEAKSIR